jgi:hypothetical protein
VKRRRWFYVAVILLLAAIVAGLFLRDWVRERILEPLILFYWFVRPYVEAIPQQVLWALFLWMALVIGGRSLLQGKERPGESKEVARPRTGRLSVWKRWIEQAAGRSAYQVFFRWRLAKNLGELTEQVMQYGERLHPKQARWNGRAEEQGIPPRIHAYLRAGAETGSYGRVSFFRRLFRLWRKDAALDLDPEMMVRFLEDQLEVNDEDGDR